MSQQRMEYWMKEAEKERDRALRAEAALAESHAALRVAQYAIQQERGYANTDHPPYKHVRDRWDEQIDAALATHDAVPVVVAPEEANR